MTISDYITAIGRELAKRATTYPKIIAKKAKQGMPAAELAALWEAQVRQVDILTTIRLLILSGPDEVEEWTHPTYARELGDELRREMKMRKKVYPRMVFFKRIDQTIADYETAVWQSLCGWWAVNVENSQP